MNLNYIFFFQLLFFVNILIFKSLRLSTEARMQIASGETTNLVTTDAQTFEHCASNLVGLISTPFQIALCVYLLYQKIGIATFFGKNNIKLLKINGL